MADIRQNMSLPSAFRLILSATILLGLGGVVLELCFQSFLPQPLQDYLRAESEADLTTSDIAAVLVAIPLLIATIVSIIGLYLWKPWSRHLFLGVWILSVLLAPFVGPYVYSGIGYALYDLSSMLSGLLLGIAYFSPVAEKFKHRKEIEAHDPANSPRH